MIAAEMEPLEEREREMHCKGQVYVIVALSRQV